MRQQRYDVVVVGARCAGATLAAFLAREGARVLALDRNVLPSDAVLSTHTVHPPGMDVLDELGVGDSVRTVAPPVRRARLRKGDAWADVSFRDGRAGACPRRKRLDGLLQDAAAEAGAELRDRTRMTEVIEERGRVTGVRVERAGRAETIAADLVVGADGRRSTVARQVAAAEYLAYDAPRAMYWAYWDAPPDWTGDGYPFDMYLAHVEDDIRVIFQTDHGQLLIGSLPAVSAAHAWRRDPLVALRRNLARDSVIGPLLSGAEPDGPVRGTLRERYFFRQAAGQGWALVGDAGHHKDFVVGDGITEAFLQARSLARAIADGGEAALERWWRARDVAALPQYFWGREEGAAGRPGELECRVVAHVARRERLRDGLTRLPEHRCSPYDVVPFGAIAACLAQAVARGRFAAAGEFLAQARRMTAYRRALRERTRLLEGVDGTG